jgi:hypothetical protein
MKPLNRLIASALILVFLLPSQLCHAWSEGGHHLIAAVAFSLLTEKEQAELISVLQKRPRYAEDFVPPEKLPNEEEHTRWLVGRSGYWPDVARRQPIYHSRRPNRCQAPGATPGRMLANRGPNRCQAPGAEPGRMLANRGPKSVPGTRCSAGPDASK